MLRFQVEGVGENQVSEALKPGRWTASFFATGNFPKSAQIAKFAVINNDFSLIPLIKSRFMCLLVEASVLNTLAQFGWPPANRRFLNETTLIINCPTYVTKTLRSFTLRRTKPQTFHPLSES